MKIKALLIGLATLVGAVSLNAQTLGVNYIGLDGTWSFDKDHGVKTDYMWAVLNGNHALVVNPDYGVDLFYAASAGLDSKKHFTHQFQDIWAGLAAYYQLMNDVRIYVEGSLGYGWDRVAYPAFPSSRSNSWSWGVGGGIEWVFSPGWSITPAILYVDYPDYSHAHSLTLGVSVNWWVSESWGVNVGYDYVDYDHGHANDVTVGVKFRY